MFSASPRSRVALGNALVPEVPLRLRAALCAAIFLSVFSSSQAAFPETFPDQSSTPTEVQPSQEKTETPPTAKSSLELSISLSSLVSDEDFRGRIQSDLVDLLISEIRLPEAKNLAATIPGFFKGTALAKVAAALGPNQKAEVAALIDEALKLAATAPFPVQKEAVQAECAIAWTATGDDARSAEIVALIKGDPALLRARSGIAVERARRGQTYEREVFYLKPLNQLNPSLLLVARAFLQIAELQLTSAAPDSPARPEVLEIARRAVEIVRESKAVAGEEYLDLGAFFLKLGGRQESAKLLGLGFQQMSAGFDLSSWKSGYFAKVLQLYLDAGKKEEVQSMLTTAQTAIKKQHAFYQVPALCELASGYLAAGDSAQAQATWLEAAQVAAANPNPDSKYLGGAQIALSVARSKQEMSAELSASLAKFQP